MGTVKPDEVLAALEEAEWDPDEAYAVLNERVQRQRNEENERWKKEEEERRAIEDDASTPTGSARRASGLMMLRKTVGRIKVAVSVKKSKKEVAQTMAKEMRGLEDDFLMKEIEHENEQKRYKKKMQDALRGIRPRPSVVQQQEEEPEPSESEPSSAEEERPALTLAEELMQLRQMAEVKHAKDLSNAGERVPYGHVQLNKKHLRVLSYSLCAWASV